MTFGETLRARRQLLAYSLRELEERTAISYANISRIERDEIAGLNVNQVYSLARALGVNPHDWCDKIVDGVVNTAHKDEARSHV